MEGFGRRFNEMREFREVDEIRNRKSNGKDNRRENRIVTPDIDYILNNSRSALFEQNRSRK